MPKKIKTLNKERFSQVLKAAKYLESVLPVHCDGYDVEITDSKIEISEAYVCEPGVLNLHTIGIYKLKDSDTDLSIVNNVV